MQVAQTLACYCCGSQELSPAFTYHEPPEDETRFSFSDENYYREVVRCTGCGHFMSIHDMDDSELYENDYFNSTYGGDRFRRTFERIISLDPDKSDNFGRCNRVVEFASQHFNPPCSSTILDVGSGLCVFLHRMKTHGWNGTALDPDPRAAAHARDIVGVDAVCGDFFETKELGRFDVVTFNKVLEHVEDPVSMLAKCTSYLTEGGFVYVELPDGEAASIHGASREEFFIEHHHIFSLASLAMLARRAGFIVQAIERLQEPSTKFTLRAFLSLPASQYIRNVATASSSTVA